MSSQVHPFTKSSSFGQKHKNVFDLIPSPSGEYLVVVRNRGRGYTLNAEPSAMLYRRSGRTFEEAIAVPPAESTFVLDDGSVVIVSGGSPVQLDHYRPTQSGLTRTTLDLGSGAFSADLLPGGRELFVTVSDRDDGQGWSEPVYTDSWLRIDVVEDKVLESRPSAFLRNHELRAPGMPWASPFDGGDLMLLRQRIKELHYQERPLHLQKLRVGPSRLMTQQRVIDVRTGKTLIGQTVTTNHVFPVIHDLSADETMVLVQYVDNSFQVWNVDPVEQVDLGALAVAEMTCARFLAGGDVVVGTSAGETRLIMAASTG